MHAKNTHEIGTKNGRIYNIIINFRNTKKNSEFSYTLIGDNRYGNSR